ncbi:DUF4132 domain-containing protein [Moraxellaceae bacterium AER2_44_116]|nr:DUF4132 domain-containing protein [Moraxellaceae bacterium]TQC95617.1 DUF4132 domain-containing protein [Moraxellaceae bacterium AER2_44_116]
MTADELLHKYFDVLAVEQLQPETCVLLNEFRVTVFSLDTEVRKAVWALREQEDCIALILLWLEFFFEAKQEGIYQEIQGDSLINELLMVCYDRFRPLAIHGYTPLPVTEEMVLMALNAFRPILYAGTGVFDILLLMLCILRGKTCLSEKIINVLESFCSSLIVMDDCNKEEAQKIKNTLYLFISQYRIVNKYFGFDPENRRLNTYSYRLLNNFREEAEGLSLTSTVLEKALELRSTKALLTLDYEDFHQLTILWTEFFFEVRMLESLEKKLLLSLNARVIPKSTLIIDCLLVALYKSKKALNELLLLELLCIFKPFSSCYNTVVFKSLINLMEWFKRENIFSLDLLQKTINFYEQYEALSCHSLKEESYLQIKSRLKVLIGLPKDDVPVALPFGTSVILPFDDKIGQRFSLYKLNYGELHSASWPALIAADIATMPLAQQHAWNILWAHAAKADGGSPKKTWLTHAKTLVKTVEDFNGKATQWLEFVLDDVKGNHVELSNAFSEANKVAIKGFIWLCSLTGSEVFASVLGGLVGFGYSKAYGVGARAPAVANAALYTLGLLGAQGVVQLSKLRSKVKFKAGLKLIEKSLAEAAARQGISQDDLEELSVPLFGLNAYSKQATFGQYHVIAHLQGSKNIQEQWSNSRDGSVLKKMPASVKQDYRSELKDWQKEITDIQDVLTGQIKRLEDSYLRKRQWHFSDWQARFIQHPLLSWLGKRLIWRFEHQGQIQHGLFLADSLVNAQQQPLTTIADDAVVTLWHPILSTVEEVQQWRTLLTAQQIVQPIKQAYREVYFITPAEIETGDYSNRFARHILKQHHFAALCKERGWGYRLQGNFDGHNHPCQGVPAWQIGVRLELDIPEGSLTTAAGLYQYITTAAVRFSHAGQSCALVDVPPIVFSEMMRDIDLFVGVTSIGTDAATDMYADNNHADYIDAFSKAELSARAIVRKDVLSNIISKLAIAPRCSFDNKHLIVKGDLRTYKIHLGSSNILMEPNDQYLCIVPSSKQKEASTEGLYLPFEGDHMLSVILSKALLLAADKKIKDEGIVSQIKRV